MLSVMDEISHIAQNHSNVTIVLKYFVYHEIMLENLNFEVHISEYNRYMSALEHNY